MLARDYPITMICQVLGLPRGSWYYEARGAAETELKAAIDQIAAGVPDLRLAAGHASTPAPAGHRQAGRAAARAAPDARAQPGPAA